MTGGRRRRTSTGDGRVAQRVSSAAWASAGWPMAGWGGRAVSRAGQLQRGLGGGEVDGGWWMVDDEMGRLGVCELLIASSEQ